MSRPALLVVIVAAAAVVLGAVACSGDTMIDRAELQRAITQKAAAGDLTFTAVDCPEGRKAVAGDTYRCSATLDTGELITVVATATDGDGTLDLEQIETVLDGAEFAAAESRAVSRDYAVTVTVTCPPRIVVDDGESFECPGTDDRGHTRSVTFTAVSADDGDFTYVVDGLPPPSTTTTMS